MYKSHAILVILLIILAVVPTPNANFDISRRALSRESNVKINAYRAREYDIISKNTRSTAYWPDSSLKYRMKVTISETDGIARYHIPVEFYMSFNPPAYYENINHHSVRIYTYDGSQELVCQVYNVSWYDYSNNLISGAYITIILESLSSGASVDIYVYWSDEEIGYTNYANDVSFQSIGNGYRFTTSAYVVTTNNNYGGKIYSIQVGGATVTQGPYDEYTKPAHFTPVVFIGGAYGTGYTINGVELLRYNAHYYFAWATCNNPNYDSAEITIGGPIFIEYRVKNLQLIAGSNVVGLVNITYRFYRDFIVTKEAVKFTAQLSNIELWMGGWEVDQEDLNRVFKQVYADISGVAYSYPVNLTDYAQIPGRIYYYEDTLDKTSTNSVWSRFSVYNPDNRFGLGTSFLGLSIQNIGNVDYDSYWINEASITDYYYGAYIGYFTCGDHKTGGDSDGWVYFYYDVERTYNFLLDYEDVGGEDEIDYIEFKLYEGGGAQVGYYYWDGDGSSENPGYIDVYWTNLDGTQANYGAWDIYWRCEATGWWDDDVDVWVDVYSLMTSISGGYAYDNYLLWTNRIRGNVDANSYSMIKQCLIPWGDDYESYFESKSAQVSGNIGVSISGVLEVYYYKLVINVVDYESKVISDAYVRIEDINGLLIDEGYTGSNGSVSFMLDRSWVSVYVNVSIDGPDNKYINRTLVGIPLDYVEVSKTIDIKFRVVRVYLKFLDAEKSTTIQNALLKLIGTESHNVTSDVRGEASFYLKVGVWQVGPLYYTYTTTSDNFTLIDQMTGTYVKDVNGDDVYNISYASINISGAVSWIVWDHQAKEVKPTSEFSIYYGSIAQSIQWGEYVYWKIRWRDELGRQIDIAESNTTSDWIAWGVYYSNNDSLVIDQYGQYMYYRYTYENVSNIRSVEDGKVLYRISIDTSTLIAGIGYYIKVEGNISSVQIPPPLYLFLDVDKIPTISSLEFSSEVYWGEAIYINLYVWDSNGTPLSDVNTRLIIYDEIYNVMLDTPLIEGDNVYMYEVRCSFLPGHYIIDISYDKPNYVGGHIQRDIHIKVRPMQISIAKISPLPKKQSSTLIEAYWGEFNMTIGLNLTDSLNSSVIGDANAICELYRMETMGAVLISRFEMPFNDTAGLYEFSIDVYGLGVGSYYFVVTFSRDCYVEKTIKTAVIILERGIDIDISRDIIEGYYNETLIQRFYVVDNLSSEFLKLSSNEVSIYTKDKYSNRTVNTTLVIYQNGTCQIIYPQDIIPGEYKTKISVYKENYQSKSIEFDVKVHPRPLDVSTYEEAFSIVWGDFRNIYFKVRDDVDKRYIYVDYTDVVVVDSFGRIVYRTILLPTIHGGVLSYVLGIDSSIFRSDESYDIHVGFYKRYYDNTTITIKMNVDPILVKAEYSKDITCRKNPFTNEGKVDVSIVLKDVSPGHGESPYQTDLVYYKIYNSGGDTVGEGKFDYEGDGIYSSTVDCKGLDIGTYRMEIYVDLHNATLVEVAEGKIVVILKVDYWGGTVEILGRLYPTAIVVPIMVAIFLSIGVAAYYAWLYIHLPWEVKYINRILKMLDKGVREFGVVDRDEEIEGVLRVLL